MNTPRPTFATIPALRQQPDASAILAAATTQAAEKGILTILPAQEARDTQPSPSLEPVRESASVPAKAPLQKRRAEKKEDPELRRLALWVPSYVIKEIEQRAHEEETTARFEVLKALSKAGYKVKAEDLVEDRRRRQS